MTFVYTQAHGAILRGEIDFANDDLRMILVMSDTTADTEEDVTFVGDFTTLDEQDGSGYARQSLASQSVSVDLTNDGAIFDADDVTFLALGAGTRVVVGAIIYKHVTNDADSPVVLYYDSSFQDPSGLDYIVEFAPTGAMYTRSGAAS